MGGEERTNNQSLSEDEDIKILKKAFKIIIKHWKKVSTIIIGIGLIIGFGRSIYNLPNDFKKFVDEQRMINEGNTAFHSTVTVNILGLSNRIEKLEERYRELISLLKKQNNKFDNLNGNGIHDEESSFIGDNTIPNKIPKKKEEGILDTLFGWIPNPF